MTDARLCTFWISGLLLAGLLLNAFAIKRALGAEHCLASTYSTSDHDQPGTKTASGIPLNDHVPTIAHRTIPLRRYAMVTNKNNGRIGVFKTTDRGPYKPGRCVDLSVAAARAIGCHGVCPVWVNPL